EACIDAGTSERTLDQGIEAERWQMPLVEHERLPEGDRSAVIGVFGDEIEQRARPLAISSVRGNGRARERVRLSGPLRHVASDLSIGLQHLMHERDRNGP